MLDDMYTELTHIRILDKEITYDYGKTCMKIMQTILRLEITKLSYIENIMLWSWLHVVLIKGNKWADIMYNINYMKVFE